MRITVFTSNQARHTALVEKLIRVSDRCHAVVECTTVFPGEVEGFFKKSEVMQTYFGHVLEAQKRIFGEPRFIDGASVLPVQIGDASLLSRDRLGDALDADAFVVFGASFIKGWLADVLVARGAINIHMGISPFYRGSSCNFWALEQGRYDLVGATLHRLSKGLDSGPMLQHVRPSADNADTPFDFTMQAVAKAQDALVEGLETGRLLAATPVAQDKAQQIHYSRNRDFTDAVASRFLAAPPAMERIRDFLRAYPGRMEGGLFHPDAPQAGA